ncbi:MAG: glycerol-3-phosphate acyltransferase [Dehalococcoidales bacterium]|nr:glycerol-3-phosphate acyltransferase [Dehalococcoidales bacterium]
MITWIVLIIVSYIIGSIPFSSLAARSRGIDLRKHGTMQVGAGNLWRTTSRKLGLTVGVFDFFKGILMVLISWRVGLDAGQQLAVGLAVVVGHNWPVFLRFHGGRGIATSLGIIIIMPLINDITPWATIAFFAIAIIVIIFTRRTPVPILIGMIVLPIASAISREPLSLTMGFVAMVLIIIVKRLTAQPATEARNIGMGRLILNRFLFDRDISDRTTWVHRKHTPKKEETE